MEASSICLDTSILIDNLRGRRQTIEFLRKLEDSGASLATTTINSFELYYGAYKSKRQAENLASTRTLLNRMLILDLTDECSDEAGRILASLEGKGELIGFRDALVAATAIMYRMTLATNDITDFSKIPDLEVLQSP